ncbi:MULTISPECIES: DUF2187 family protein [Bacillus cereus group]|uniref:DUF2187 family protein n=1 Tax=Bacillus cereus group TaxID=86661 RepID=UPI000BEE63E6|nr:MULTISPECIES: DUF2187 family protein [Bacillus cereus group]PEF65900.1 DUF2187 domain-containing protein [Bacillus cereus]
MDSKLYVQFPYRKNQELLLTGYIVSTNEHTIIVDISEMKQTHNIPKDIEERQVVRHDAYRTIGK